jgi:hypothetical protein
MMPATRMAASNRPRVSVVAGRMAPRYRCVRIETGLVVPGPRSPSASGVSTT